MMAQPTAATGTDSVRDEFLALVLTDPDLVDAEFDAIMTGAWPSSPPPCAPHATAGPRADGPGRDLGTITTVGVVRATARPRRPGAGGWGRQRSPPTTGSPDL